jgi:hypothetical protein
VSLLDDICPRYIREKRITLALEPGAATRAFGPILLTVDYSKAAPEGVVLPLILEVQGPSAQSYQRREFTRVAPSSVLFTPREGGTHSVVLREAGHNRWFGSLRVSVEGERLEA